MIGKAPELELVENKALNVSMQLPKGRAVVQDSGEYGAMWTYSSVQISLEAAPKEIERDEDLHKFRVSEGLELEKKFGGARSAGGEPSPPKSRTRTDCYSPSAPARRSPSRWWCAPP
jgi:hypothetical protein